MADKAGPFDEDPDTAFLVPGPDPGLSAIAPARPHWTVRTGAAIRGITLTDNRRIARRWATHLATIDALAPAGLHVEFASGLAVAENLTIRQGCFRVAGKWLFAGPMGERLLGYSFRAGKRRISAEHWVESLNAQFARAAECAGDLPLWTGEARQLDFVIEARNLANYFHFTKELLCALCLLAEVPDWSGRIRIVAERPEMTGFARNWIAALFPEFADRVDLVADPQNFECALVPFHGDFPGLQDPQTRAAILAPDHPLAQGPYGSGFAKSLRHLGHTRALRLLRERGREKAAAMPADTLPRRFWIGRRSAASHDRTMRNEAAIKTALTARGIETLYFEDLSPLEQIAAMARAELVTSYHGAGFTNMLYAAPTTRVIELGTLQTGILRLGDFAAFAHVSGCDYTIAVADYEHDGPEVIPPMRGRGLYPVRLEEAGLAAYLALIDEKLGT